MNRISSLSLSLVLCTLAIAAPAKLQPEIMGVALGMNRDEAHARLESIGKLQKEERKRQEVWTVRDARISHLLVGFDQDWRVRYVTAIARTGGPRIRYDEIAQVKSAQRTHNQGNYKFTWEVRSERGQFGYLLVAHGHDRQYLDTYSIKKIDQK